MRFMIYHQRAFQLSTLAASVLLADHPVIADWNRNNGNDKNSLIDILPDTSCPDFTSGRLSIDECRGYVDCMNGFEIDRAQCKEGTLYSTRTENCEPRNSVRECNGVLVKDDTVNNQRIALCPDGFCLTPSGGCGVMHQCLINPCEVNSCEEGQECVANYCGGCHATCTLTLNVIDQRIDDGNTTTSPPATTTTQATADDGGTTTRPPPKTTTTPEMIDDSGKWVQDNSGSTSSTLPQIVYDGGDLEGTSSTTAATEAATSTTATAATQNYIPSWTKHTCVPEESNSSRKSENRRLGSSWRASYPTQYECCINYFMYSLELFESCVGFDLEMLEPPSRVADDSYYPEWSDGKCKAADGTEDEWVTTTFRSKKYLCCFEYFKWDFDNCLKSQS
eukprot:CCRYP_021094-RA/>CCRYP_021094-RA protein AED:0.30 eAED:0.30 QI:0/-1/0/1/-1/1/1/0/391